MTRSISRTLEYRFVFSSDLYSDHHANEINVDSYNDFCISLIASGLNKLNEKEKYERTSEYWSNLYKADQTSLLLNTSTDTGFVGFFQPRNLNQTWAFQDPLECSNIDTSTTSVCSLQVNAVETYESSVWEYSFYVPHDQARLISTMGGPETFVRRLDYLHDRNITYIGNEPSFLTVFQYHYAGMSPLSPFYTRQAIH